MLCWHFKSNSALFGNMSCVQGIARQCLTSRTVLIFTSGAVGFGGVLSDSNRFK